MTITLNATPGSGTMKSYYVAFYNKTLAATPLSPLISDVATGTPNSTLQNYLHSNPANGFLAAYDVSSAKFYIWDPTQGNGTWVDITGKDTGQPINNSSGCNFTTHLCYKIYPGDPLNILNPDPTLPNTWTVLLDQGFGSKIMYTGVQAVNSFNQTTTNPDISPL